MLLATLLAFALAGGASAGAAFTAPRQPETEKALGRQAIELLLRDLKSPSSELRADAAAAWGEMGNPTANPILIKALRDKNIYVRIAAALSLQKLGNPAGLRALKSIAQRSPRGSGSPGGAAELLALSRNEARAKAVLDLSEIGGVDVVRLFERLLNDPSPMVRDATKIALAKMGFDEYADPFVAALRDDDPGIRAAAALDLGKIATPKVLAPLLKAATDPAPEVRKAVMEALGRFSDPDAILALRKGLSDEDARVRFKALQSIAGQDDDGSVSILNKLIGGNPTADVQLEALRALARRKQSVDMDNVEANLNQGDPDLRAIVVSILGEVQSSRSTSLLARVMKGDPSARVRLEAAGLLIRRLEKPLKKKESGGP